MVQGKNGNAFPLCTGNICPGMPYYYCVHPILKSFLFEGGGLKTVSRVETETVTSQLQPLDIQIDKSSKDHIWALYSEWPDFHCQKYAEACLNQRKRPLGWAKLGLGCRSSANCGCEGMQEMWHFERHRWHWRRDGVVGQWESLVRERQWMKSRSVNSLLPPKRMRMFSHVFHTAEICQLTGLPVFFFFLLQKSGGLL